jgi:NAD-dependent protein deacetylase/lipoamidase
LSNSAGEFLLVTQNVDDLHARAGIPRDKMVQIHGSIFVTRCSRCDYEHEHEHEGMPRCAACDALMRPGVVWFGEQLDSNKIDRVEQFLGAGPCDYVFVIGTTAIFGYIVDWAMRGSENGGQLIEVNPETTQLSRFASRHVREPAAIALPGIVEELLTRCP